MDMEGQGIMLYLGLLNQPKSRSTFSIPQYGPNVVALEPVELQSNHTRETNEATGQRKRIFVQSILSPRYTLLSKDKKNDYTMTQRNTILKSIYSPIPLARQSSSSDSTKSRSKRISVTSMRYSDWLVTSRVVKREQRTG